MCVCVVCVCVMCGVCVCVCVCVVCVVGGTIRQATDDNIIGRMRFESWITKATNTH